MYSSRNIKCNHNLLENIRYNLSNFEPKSKHTDGKRAAVAIAITDMTQDTVAKNTAFSRYSPNDSCIIITTRAAKLKNHAGQWALPGGKIDRGETAESTALRELSEEVGLNIHPDKVLGYLDDFVTRSGFVITPLILWAGRNVNLTPNLQEVNSIYRIPIAELLRDDAPGLEYMGQGQNPILYMPIGISWVAAPTAALLYQFREVAILGNNVRVDHFEQPYFAWK